MKIDWLISGTAPEWIEENYSDGGFAYDTMARRLLRKSHDVNIVYLPRRTSGTLLRKSWGMTSYILRAAAVRCEGDVVVRDIFSTVFSPFDPKRSHVVMLHHLDTIGFKYRPFYKFLTRSYQRRILRANLVIAVSEHWKQQLTAWGCRNVVVIYNSFDIADFRFTGGELLEFRKRYGFDGRKPLIYLGNAVEAKGYTDAYEALRDIDAVFVVTGKRQVKLPVKQLYLPYRDYLKLLSVASLVLTMSRFEEGWCRTAHEGMLSGTPVVGSGKGGMRELLDGGGQIVCENLRDLRRIVGELLKSEERRKVIGEKGQEYASRFNSAYFERAWNSAIGGLRGVQ